MRLDTLTVDAPAHQCTDAAFCGQACVSATKAARGAVPAFPMWRHLAPTVQLGIRSYVMILLGHSPLRSVYSAVGSLSTRGPVTSSVAPRSSRRIRNMTYTLFARDSTPNLPASRPSRGLTPSTRPDSVVSDLSAPTLLTSECHSQVPYPALDARCPANNALSSST